MTQKEELEILRGEPIEVFTGDPMDIPCIETSDPEKLCKHPVVSVHMITYNHEPYIRQAIEGVMMQKTDFEFELVIGEDASTDKTREICFEYQKKYPDRIRVLWWHENLYRNPHPAGGNGVRTRAHCRGEFIAFCEGDDYWIDPLKLQKQVDVMRRFPSVGICSGTYVRYLVHENRLSSRFDLHWPLDQVIPSEKAFLWMLYGMNPEVSPEHGIHTATVLLRKSVLEIAVAKYGNLFSFRFALGDLQLWLGLTAESDLYILRDPVSIYRVGGGGLMTYKVSAKRVRRDGMMTVFYFTRQKLGLGYEDIPHSFVDSWITSTCYVLAETNGDLEGFLRKLGQFDFCRKLIGRRRYRIVRWASIFSCGRFVFRDESLYARINFRFGNRISARLKKYYLYCAPSEFNAEVASLKRRVKRIFKRVYVYIRVMRFEDLIF